MESFRNRFGPAGAASLFAAAGLLSVTGALQAQGVIPATAPTAITPSQLPSANPAVTLTHAEVNWDGRLLQVTTDGEPLSRVLERIAQRTGVRLSGTAPNERIFGTYGPAPLVEMVGSLLDGLPVNLLFVDRSGSRPPELLLTSRNGGATPPGTTFAQANTPSQPAAPQSEAVTQFPVRGIVSNTGVPGSAPGALGTAEANQNSSGSTDAASAPQQSPNGVKTPQEIFEQLQRLRANANANR